MYVDMEECRKLLNANSADALVRIDMECAPDPIRTAVEILGGMGSAEVGHTATHVYRLLARADAVLVTLVHHHPAPADWTLVFHKNAFTTVDR